MSESDKKITDVLAEKIKWKGPVLPKRIISSDDKKLYGPALKRPSVKKSEEEEDKTKKIIPNNT